MVYIVSVNIIVSNKNSPSSQVGVTHRLQKGLHHKSQATRASQSWDHMLLQAEKGGRGQGQVHGGDGS